VSRVIIGSVVFVACLFAIGSRVSAGDQAIARFFGEYEGRSVQAPNEPLSPRDLSIKIAPHGDNGFSLEWATVIRDASGTRRQNYSIDFSPSDRTGIFASAMHRDTFGHSEPLDPLKGEPYVWADIHGSTLRVHALLITADGGYEMQVYRRTLMEDGKGLALQFSRNRNGRELKTIYGVLRKTG